MRTFLPSKLHPPEPIGDEIFRSHLLARLNAGLSGPLTVVSAAAGSGKTTLLAAWVRSLIGRIPMIAAPLAHPTPPRELVHAAWLSLDETDNDPRIFLRDLVMAARGETTDFGSDLPPAPRAVATMLADDHGLAPFPRLLVLDDYQEIREPAVHEILEILLRGSPPQMHIAIATRGAPDDTLARLTGAARSFVALGSADLAFTPEEAIRFLRIAVGPRMTEAVAGGVYARTEGWAAGLRLAALRMEQYADLTEFSREFHRQPDRWIVDYLIESVLGRQPPEVQRFLMGIAVLDAFDAGLAAMTLGDISEADARAMVARAAAMNLFIVPLGAGGEWFRFHALFREVLWARQHEQFPPAELIALHRRAAEWLIAHDKVSEALPQLLAMGEADRAANLIESRLASIREGEEWRAFAGWLAQLPDELVQRRPALLLALAEWRVAQFEIEVVPSIVTRAAALLESGAGVDADSAAFLWGQVDALRAALPGSPLHLDERLALADRALALLREDRNLHSQTVITKATLLRIGGRVAEARRLLEDAAGAPDRVPTRAQVRLLEALYRFHDAVGTLDELAAAAERCHEAALSAGADGVALRAMAARAGAEWLANRQEEAVRLFEPLLERAHLIDPDLVVQAAFPLMNYHAQRGNLVAAEQVAAHVRRLADAAPSARHGIHAHQAEGYLALLRGDRPAVLAWLARAPLQRTPELTPNPVAFAWVLHVRMLMAVGSHASLIEALALMTQAQGNHSREVVLRGWLDLNLACVHWRLSARRRALAHFRRVLAFTAPRGDLWPYVEAGQPAREMLAVLAAGQGRHAADAASTLARLPERWPFPPLVDAPVGLSPLSERELHVIRLMAQGHSNPAIAQRLGISAHTVRNHTAHIFVKLGVRSRREAVSAARALGLAPAPPSQD